MPNNIINPKGRLNLNESTRDLTKKDLGLFDHHLDNFKKKLQSNQKKNNSSPQKGPSAEAIPKVSKKRTVKHLLKKKFWGQNSMDTAIWLYGSKSIRKLLKRKKK